MTYVWTVVGTTAAIILAEIFGNYGLGDLVKDFFTRVFGKAKTLTEAKVSRLKAQLSKVLILLVALMLVSGVAKAQTFEVVLTDSTDFVAGGDFSLLLQGGSHSVDLTWTASPDGGTSNIYRAMAACSTNPTFSKIGSAPVGAVGFTDTGLVSNTYCYQVTAVVNGLESGPSNSAPAVVVPSSQTGLTAKQSQ